MTDENTCNNCNNHLKVQGFINRLFGHNRSAFVLVPRTNTLDFYPRPVLPVFKTTGIRCLEPWLKRKNGFLEQEMSKNKKQYKRCEFYLKFKCSAAKNSKNWRTLKQKQLRH